MAMHAHSNPFRDHAPPSTLLGHDLGKLLCMLYCMTHKLRILFSSAKTTEYEIETIEWIGSFEN